ncbi:MAG: peptide deformylase [Gemmatimonadetes bacterium]|nr:peptide deformylase [Gemmatimonadota bacterium]NIR81189.1 peptide deformylase [Gemmatimonadota bacterium]NIT90030.1 peptide deformylase [Gemmatimonadota bacterium]NIU33837.1 peptide deformylase [Gemmatimonadota bacterium]NIU38040.1 peptide deformylase [Gemmatimonadota bacterium]
MSIREIELLGSEVLRRPGEEVEAFDDELRELVRDMFETMYHADGIGLAAPQIGVSLRLFVIDVPEDHVERGQEAFRAAVVNPRVVEVAEETEKAPEGCLSIPGLEGVVERPSGVVIEAFDPEGEPMRIEAGGLVARALQHEIDHLDGVLFIDRVSPLKRKMLLKKWKKARAEAEEEAAAL